MDYQKKQPIIEAYTCIQTEGSMAGRPHFLIRTTGCTHRCYFGEGGWCDSWYTSIHPEKGSWTLNQISDLFKANTHIKHLMISGGSPTMHPELVNEIISLANDDRRMFTTLETEGSHFIKTDLPIDLVSLSPKFHNSRPIKGILTPEGKIVDQKFVDQHEKFRMNLGAMKELIDYHTDYHFKPVVDKNDADFIWEDIDKLAFSLSIPKEKIWVMPAGDTLSRLQPNYSYVMEECIKRGYNFTGRAHIVAYNDKRGV